MTPMQSDPQQRFFWRPTARGLRGATGSVAVDPSTRGLRGATGATDSIAVDPSTRGLRVATGATGSVAVDPSTGGLRGATGRSEELPLEKTRATDLEAVEPFAGLEEISRTPYR